MAIAANFPTVRPSLLLDFSNQTVLDPRVTFARTTTALFYDNKSAALAEQNLLTYSNTFTNAAWSATGVGTPVVGATDPAGGSTAYTLTTGTAATSVHSILSTTTIASSSTYTLTAYLQAGAGVGSYNFASLSANNGTNYIAATFTLTGAGTAGTPVVSGTYTSGGATISQIGSTAWYRCSVTYTTSSTSSNNVIQMNTSATPTLNSGGQQAWTAAGTETLLIYGAQLEQRSSPTVYTATTANAVNTYTPTLQSAAINAPRFDYNPTTRESLGLLLEQASTNLALYSSDYTNAAWTKTACTITAAADISPDGTQNASLMVLGTTSVARYFYQSTTFTAAAYTVSVYLKYYGQRFVQIISQANGTVLCNFDLIDGTAGTPSGSGSPTASIQNAGNGWYRCSITYTATAVSANNLISASNSLTATANPAFAGNGFNGYLIWGAQVELAPSATSYIATVASAQTRTVDAASMTGTNFTSWYNYSGGTVYWEANLQGSNTSGSGPTGYIYAIGDGTSSNYLSALVDNNQRLTSYVYRNGVAQSSYLNTGYTNGAFVKAIFAYQVNSFATSLAGGTPVTLGTGTPPNAVTTLYIGNGYNGSLPMNGRIKKFAYYPLALTNTQIQSLSAN
jgi:hypothetical protein